jgi:hypothetical protein
MIRKLMALVGLVIACGGIGLFVALGIYVWSLKTEVNKQTATLTANANRAGDEADKAIGFVDDVINQAKVDLENARPTAARKTRPVSALEMALAQSASARLAGSVDQAQGAVVTASDAVVVAEAALKVFDKVFDENPDLNRLLGVQPSQVDATKSTLYKASSELRHAQSALGGTPTTEQLNAVDIALNQAQGFTQELSKVVNTIRKRVNTTRATVDQWTWRIAIGTTLVSLLAGIGQLFMARYFWRNLRGQPA